MKKTLSLFVLLSCVVLDLSAQPQNPGGPGGRRDPGAMVKAEKQLVLDSISGLNDDQKLIIDQIYQDYESSFAKARETMTPDNREAARATMTAIRDSKNEALQAILTEEQFGKYQALMEMVRERAREQRSRH